MEDITCVGDLSKVLLDNAISEWDLYFFKASNKKYKIKNNLNNIRIAFEYFSIFFPSIYI